MASKILRFMTKYLIPFFVIFILMFFLFGGFRGKVVSGNEKYREQKREEKVIEESKVVEKSIPIFTRLIGTTKAVKKIFIVPQISGYITSLNLSAGKRVRKGELLLTIDDTLLKSNVNELKAKIEELKVNLEQAYSDYKRDRALFENKVIPSIEFEHSRTKYMSLKKEIRVIKRKIDVLKVKLSYTKIFAPCSGIIVDKLAEKGDLAIVGKPVASMYRNRDLWLEASVPESLMKYIKLKEKIRYSIPSLSLEEDGVVDEIVPQGNSLSRTVLVRVRLKPHRDLIAGLYGEIYLKRGEKKILLVDGRAIYSFGQLKMVKLKSGNTYLSNIVILGKKYGNFFEVLSGLKNGDVVAILRKGDGNGR